MSEEVSEGPFYCYRHPDRETYLRCGRCGRPICTECAVLTPTGYRCPECVRQQQRAFNTAQWWDYPVGVILGLGIAYLGSLLAVRIGFLTLFLAPLVGLAVAESVRWAAHRRRSKTLFLAVTVAAGAGCAPAVVLAVLAMASGGWMLLLWQGLYAALVISSTYYRLTGIQI